MPRIATPKSTPKPAPAPVKTVTVAPEALAELSAADLRLLLESVQSTIQARPIKVKRERIVLSDAIKTAADKINWQAPYSDGSETFEPENRKRSNVTNLTPVYEAIGQLLKRGPVSFSVIVQIYSSVVTVESKVRSLKYILQQVANRLNRTIKLEADKVTVV
jgi:hypothetical protein